MYGRIPLLTETRNETRGSAKHMHEKFQEIVIEAALSEKANRVTGGKRYNIEADLDKFLAERRISKVTHKQAMRVLK